MSLDDSYFDYPHRKRGLDHDLFAMRYLKDAPRVDFGGGTRLALWVTVDIDFFPLDMPKTPFLPSGGLGRPYPDLWNFTTRDYGNRVGIYRLLEVLGARGIRPTAFVQGEAAQRMPALMDDLAGAGAEFAAGGWSMGNLHATPLPAEEERALIAKTREALSPWAPELAGWHSPASSETARTPDLVAEAGFGWIADWANDDMPYPFANGLTAMPLAHDLTDRAILFEQNQTVQQWAAQLGYAADVLLSEAETAGGRILNLTLTPWVTGQPYRIDAVAALLDRLLGLEGLAPRSAADILQSCQFLKEAA
ncbi:polysaccharide deacetylase family protein [Pseudoroseicyclus aestuarii]|uniref:Chitooligosaccharide deacetylase n=1 Tax=Pseudoroseicyclus aestuarii TaxID=1795041 RepID=A0A318SV26_9RHOB|nr:polysaccharide deacetylase family protein [Pseudoroseicyclus aestuarii]PYE85342.1 peptidoglycan/xylan/chitin deacetylase (PgdA/CDA1 family) [Pseudoroseicyclus aestuarii]